MEMLGHQYNVYTILVGLGTWCEITPQFTRIFEAFDYFDYAVITYISSISRILVLSHNETFQNGSRESSKCLTNVVSDAFLATPACF